ncbi:His Kinase A (phospho-acceptor) domain-containing protein [Dyadobacter soli]|uniref:histidine kinase n=1 Tax=Dyadobacter soli TaxID=659014 RepID=A0A1G7NS14_9BACT|nr:HAMP domain-containing sensor histidine kinase [Dyadobacter soli]SDF76782.1 His Kinase A (phospho-acceptor) domain-containing protein [Dyadobacter soli]
MTNRRIRSIFWLMSVCIVAINAFQAYWLLTTYRLNREQFGNTVQDALFQVIEGHQVDHARQLFGGEPSRDVPGTPPGGTPDTPGGSIPKAPGGNIPRESRVVVRRLGSSSGGSRFYYKFNNDSAIIAPADTLARRISRFVVQEWAEDGRIDMRKVYSAYRDELMRRGIDAAFKLDTLTILPNPGSSNVIIFNGLGLRVEEDGSFKTFPLPVNPVRHTFVQATFDMPVPYLLKRMGWLLGGSALLLLLTTGCFVFMLRTILRQKKLSDIKNDFINNMTHELKTPIATVTAAVDALLHFGALNDPRKTEEYLNISQNNLQRLSDLVEKVLNLAVEEKQDFEFHTEPVSLAEILCELAASHRIKAAKTVVFNMHIPFGTMVQVDRMHFGNVINNLIDNAIKYSYERVTISFNYEQEPHGWQLTVSDNGIGIPKAYQTSVFDRFFRVPTGDLHQVKGFGLGLAYVRQVVEKHGGSISLASEPGKGSAFVLKF